MKLKKTLVMVLAACLLIGTIAGTAMADVWVDPAEHVEIPGAPIAWDQQGNAIAWNAPEGYEGWWGTGEGYWFYYVHGTKQYHWQYIDGEWYYFLPSTGRMVQNGTAWIEGRLYVFNPSGACVTNPGWYKFNTYFYVYENEVPTAFYPETGYSWVYLNQNGYVETGWNYIDGAWRMIDRWSGRALASEWYHNVYADYWYYFNENAEMVTGWQTVKTPLTNRTYYFNEYGVLQYGWKNIDGNWYYLSDDNGARIEDSWALIKNPVIGDWWYLFDKNGVMQTGWQKVEVVLPGGGNDAYDLTDANGNKVGRATLNNGNGSTKITQWYYLLPWGAMVTGDQYIEGRLYSFADTGELLGYYDQASNYLVPAN